MSDVLPLFYKKVVALNAATHSAMRVNTTSGYDFARQANAIMLAGIEFAQASREYPIVFVNEGDTYSPVVVTGLEKGRNQFVKADGSWAGEYVPAYLRRYPFILATDGSSDQLAVCIDEESPLLSKEQGEALFTSDGKQTPYLQKMINLLSEYQTHGKLSQAFGTRLNELNLLEPMRADVEIAAGGKFSVSGFYLVSQERLKALKPAKLAELVKRDELALIYAHLASLDNFKRLMQRMQLAS